MLVREVHAMPTFGGWRAAARCSPLNRPRCAPSSSPCGRSAGPPASPSTRAPSRTTCAPASTRSHDFPGPPRPDPRLRCFHLWPASSPRAYCRLRRPVAGSSRSSAPNAPGVVRAQEQLQEQPNDARLPRRPPHHPARAYDLLRHARMGITLSVYEASRGPSCATASVQMRFTAKIRRFDFRDCGPPQPSHRRSQESERTVFDRSFPTSERSGRARESGDRRALPAALG